jgi:hypothetical protein
MQYKRKEKALEAISLIRSCGLAIEKILIFQMLAQHPFVFLLTFRSFSEIYLLINLYGKVIGFYFQEKNLPIPSGRLFFKEIEKIILYP